MKKLLLAFGALVLALGVFADGFDDFVKLMQDNTPNCGFVREAKKYRIVFLDYRISGKEIPTDVKLAAVKKDLVKGWKSYPQLCDVIKSNRISVFVNYINGDGRIFTIIVTPDDL